MNTKLAHAPSASGRLAPYPPASAVAAAAMAPTTPPAAASRLTPLGGGAMDTADRDAWAGLLGEADVPPALLSSLVLASRAREVAQGEQVLSRRDVASHLVLVVRGDVALGVAQADAPFLPERTVHGPDWLDSSSAWLSAPHGLDAVALSPARVLALPLTALLTLLPRSPELAPRLLTGLARQVHTLSAAAHDLMHKDAEARVAAWMVPRCVPLPADGGAAPTTAPSAVVELKERKRDIAAQLGITPETLSRLLRQLIRKGLIDVSGYRITVHDTAALQALAAG